MSASGGSADIANSRAFEIYHALFRARFGNGLADRRQRRGIVEFEALALRLQSEIAPQGCEIGGDGLRSHLVMQMRQHIDADGPVGGGENAIDRPVLFMV